jgi:hypothetical protein
MIVTGAEHPSPRPEPARGGSKSLRNSIFGQRFTTTVTPFAHARSAASSLTTPSPHPDNGGQGVEVERVVDRPPAAAELRNTSTMSIGAGTSARRA